MQVGGPHPSTASQVTVTSALSPASRRMAAWLTPNGGAVRSRTSSGSADVFVTPNGRAIWARATPGAHVCAKASAPSEKASAGRATSALWCARQRCKRHGRQRYVRVPSMGVRGWSAEVWQGN